MDEINKIEELEDEKLAKERAGLSIRSSKDLTSFFEEKDHSVNQILFSEIPDKCKNEPCQLGVDEAGRGPVLGPMVYGISYSPLSRKQLLVDIGCADSKSLTEEKRNVIFDKICEEENEIGWAIESISPESIANSMYRRGKVSLNEISMSSAVGLIKKAIESGITVSEIYVDTVGPPDKYQTKLMEIFPNRKVMVAKKADSTYPIVSAASICAKVSRDRAIRAWQFREGAVAAEYGSGYPNDPVTKGWLMTNVDKVFGFPRIVRFSWSTAEKMVESNACTVDWEDTESEEESSVIKISKFFARTPPKTSKKTTSHKFFSDRCLTNAFVL